MKKKLFVAKESKCLIIFLIVIFTVSMAQEENFKSAIQKLPEEFRETSVAAIQKAGINKNELLQAIENCPAEHREAVGFLISNMPERDLTSLSADFILENIAFAYKAIEAVPWGKDIPEEILLNYVLPYVNIHERRDNWRKDFFEKFLPVITDSG